MRNGPEIYHYYGFNSPGKSLIGRLRKEIAPLRFDLAAKAIVHELQIGSQDRILEIGCGIGLLAEAIKRRINNNVAYYGVDILFDPLKHSKEKGVLSIRADAVSLPYKDGAFDSIVSTDVFEHVPDAVTLIKETYRVLKPGGKAFIVIADPAEGRFKKTKTHISRTNGETDVDYWESIFVDNGFEILPSSHKYRRGDLRRVFNLPVLRRLKQKPFFSCAFRIVDRPGVFILQKPMDK